jgi:hypothetical protein
MGDLGSYIASIDVRMAIGVAAAAVIVAMVVRSFVLATAEEGLDAIPVIGTMLARSALARRRGLASRPWFCRRCRSLNPASATLCYRGCGPRSEQDAGPLPGEVPNGPSDGTSRRGD